MMNARRKRTLKKLAVLFMLYFLFACSTKNSYEFYPDSKPPLGGEGNVQCGHVDLLQHATGGSWHRREIGHFCITEGQK